MNYLQMLIKPLSTMWGNIQLLIPAMIVGILHSILNAFLQLIEVDGMLVVGLIAMVLLDLISGVYKALINKNLVSSMGLRQTTIKIIEYTLAVFGFVVLSNMAEMEWIRTSAFVWLGFIEMKSIVENLTDKKGVINELYSTIKDKFSNSKS